MDRKLKGSTLIEVLIAIVIVSIIVTITSLLLLNVQRAKYTTSGGTQLIFLDQVLQQEIQLQQFKNKKILTEHGEISIRFSPRIESELLLQADLLLYSPKGEIISTLHKLVVKQAAP